jgi:hypothetical protein
MSAAGLAIDAVQAQRRRSALDDSDRLRMRLFAEPLMQSIRGDRALSLRLRSVIRKKGKLRWLV